jgi:hypothetical protein
MTSTPRLAGQPEISPICALHSAPGDGLCGNGEIRNGVSRTEGTSEVGAAPTRRAAGDEVFEVLGRSGVIGVLKRGELIGVGGFDAESTVRGAEARIGSCAPGPIDCYARLVRREIERPGNRVYPAWQPVGTRHGPSETRIELIARRCERNNGGPLASAEGGRCRCCCGVEGNLSVGGCQSVEDAVGDELNVLMPEIDSHRRGGMGAEPTHCAEPNVARARHRSGVETTISPDGVWRRCDCRGADGVGSISSVLCGSDSRESH